MDCEDRDRDIEILISRHLDGVLDEDEELALNRELIRNPDAQRLMDECRQVDALAGAALGHAVPDRIPSWDPTALSTRRRPRRPLRYHRGWLLLPGAVAAALLAVIVARTAPPGANGPRMVGQGRVPSMSAPSLDPCAENAGGIMQQVGTTPVPRRRITRDLTRDVYGVLGEDDRIYWIEVDRMRTIKRPNAKSEYRLVSEEL